MVNRGNKIILIGCRYPFPQTFILVVRYMYLLHSPVLPAQNCNLTVRSLRSIKYPSGVTSELSISLRSHVSDKQQRSIDLLISSICSSSRAKFFTSERIFSTRHAGVILGRLAQLVNCTDEGTRFRLSARVRKDE